MQSTQHHIIGLTSALSTNTSGSPVVQVGLAYIDAILKTGAIPLVISPGMDQYQVKTLVSRVDGILFTGGGDLDPRTFKCPHPPKI
jgi:putative glutamine amidotransferase